MFMALLMEYYIWFIVSGLMIISFHIGKIVGYKNLQADVLDIIDK